MFGACYSWGGICFWRFLPYYRGVSVFFFLLQGYFFPASGRVRDFYNVWVWYALSMELVLLAVGVSRELALSNLGVDAN